MKSLVLLTSFLLSMATCLAGFDYFAEPTVGSSGQVDSFLIVHLNSQHHEGDRLFVACPDMPNGYWYEGVQYEQMLFPPSYYHYTDGDMLNKQADDNLFIVSPYSTESSFLVRAYMVLLRDYTCEDNPTVGEAQWEIGMSLAAAPIRLGSKIIKWATSWHDIQSIANMWYFSSAMNTTERLAVINYHISKHYWAAVMAGKVPLFGRNAYKILRQYTDDALSFYYKNIRNSSSSITRIVLDDGSAALKIRSKRVRGKEGAGGIFKKFVDSEGNDVVKVVSFWYGKF